MESLVKHEKVSKHYENDCRLNPCWRKYTYFSINLLCHALQHLTCFYQREQTIIYLLHKSYQRFMKKLAPKFISASVIQTYISQGKSFSELDISMANQKPDIDEAVGLLTSNKLKKLLNEGDIDQRAVDIFYDGVRGFYGCAYNYCVKWLKLDCPFLKNCQFADSNKRNEMSYKYWTNYALFL